MSKMWKANDGRTEGQMTDNRPWHKLIWSKAPGELINLLSTVTHKAPVSTAADDTNIIIIIFHKKYLDMACELSAMQMIHMKCQALLSTKNNKNK